MTPSLVLSIPLTSLLAGVLILLLGEPRRKTRIAVNLVSALAKLVLIGFLMRDVRAGIEHVYRRPLMMGYDLVLNADAMSLLFVTLSGLLWLVTTIYAIGYLDSDHGVNRCRFFCFFSFCVSASTGIALAGNLFTYFVFYELLTITTYPLVTHNGDKKSIQAGRKYLVYTLGGGAVLLLAIVWLKTLIGTADFAVQGIVSRAMVDHRQELTVIFAMLMIGFGVKSALIPLHGWLPAAMVAPAPVSALLHAVAVVKAGAFGIVRVVYDVFGVDTVTELGVRPYLIAWFSITILYGSSRALFQDDFKRRLAFSTVSQLSYIGLGAAVAGPLATIGGIVHIVHQGIMKITMFFCAGNLAQELHIKKVSQMDGCGARMPVSMTAFTIAAFGMIGVPPLAGFVSKWMLGLGAIEAGRPEVIWVLLGSSALNAMYFLPILHRAWFRPPRESFPLSNRPGSREISWALLLPPAFTALLVILAGVLAGAEWAPLAWAKLIALREYGP